MMMKFIAMLSMLLALCLGPTTMVSARTGAGPSARQVPTADQIKLVTDQIIDGEVIERSINGLILLRRADGTTELMPARAIVGVRRFGGVDWVPLEAVLGEVASSDDGPPTGEQGEAEDDRDSAPQVSILHLDHDEGGWNSEIAAAHTEAWARLTAGIGSERMVLVVCVDAPFLSLESVLWLQSMIRNLPVGSDIRIVVHRATVTALPLFKVATRAHWTKAGGIESTLLDPAIIDRLRSETPPGLGWSAVEALGSNRSVGLDSTNTLEARDAPAGSIRIDESLAQACGLNAGTVGSVGRADVRSLLSLGPESRLRDCRVSTLVASTRQARARASVQVAKAHGLVADIDRSVAAIRSAARSFDTFYRRYDVDSIWRKDRSWSGRDLENRSTDLQKAIRDGILSLKNASNRLKILSTRLPEGTPEKPGFGRCQQGAAEALRRLQRYERSIRQNEASTYEATRSEAMGISVEGC